MNIKVTGMHDLQPPLLNEKFETVLQWLYEHEYMDLNDNHEQSLQPEGLIEALQLNQQDHAESPLQIQRVQRLTSKEREQVKADYLFDKSMTLNVDNLVSKREDSLPTQ